MSNTITPKETFTGKLHADTTALDSTEAIGKTVRTTMGVVTISGSVTRDAMLNGTLAAYKEISGDDSATKKQIEDTLNALITANNSAIKSADAVIKAEGSECASVSVWTPLGNNVVKERKDRNVGDASILLKIGAKRKELTDAGIVGEAADVDPDVVALTEEFNASMKLTAYDDCVVSTKSKYVKGGTTAFDDIISRRSESAAEYAAKHGERDKKKKVAAAAKATAKALAATEAAAAM